MPLTNTDNDQKIRNQSNEKAHEKNNKKKPSIGKQRRMQKNLKETLRILVKDNVTGRTNA